MAYERANLEIALGLCGLSLQAFRRLTPAEFYVNAQARITQRNEEWKFRDLLNGVHCSVLANINRSEKTPPYKAEDFTIMREKKRQTPEEIARIMDQLAGVNHA